MLLLPYNPGDSGQLLLAHELYILSSVSNLVVQVSLDTSILKFKTAGQSYENNKLEREANDFERQCRVAF